MDADGEDRGKANEMKKAVFLAKLQEECPAIEDVQGIRIWASPTWSQRKIRIMRPGRNHEYVYVATSTAFNLVSLTDCLVHMRRVVRREREEGE